MDNNNWIKCPKCGLHSNDWSFLNNCSCGCVYVVDTIRHECIEYDKWRK